jgi:hypothetical protein
MGSEVCDQWSGHDDMCQRGGALSCGQFESPRRRRVQDPSPTDDSCGPDAAWRARERGLRRWREPCTAAPPPMHDRVRRMLAALRGHSASSAATDRPPGPDVSSELDVSPDHQRSADCGVPPDHEDAGETAGLAAIAARLGSGSGSAPPARPSGAPLDADRARVIDR